MTLISPETPRPRKLFRQLHLNGHAYTYYLDLKWYRPQSVFAACPGLRPASSEIVHVFAMEDK
jgi:hypothetical protein